MRFFFLGVAFLLSMSGSQVLCSEEPQCRRVLFIMSQLTIGGGQQSFVSMINGWSIPNTKVEIALKKREGVLEERLRKDFPIISMSEACSRAYDVAVCFGEWMSPKKGLWKVSAKRKVQWIHTDLLKYQKPLPFKQRGSFHGIDAFVCVSENAAKSARTLAPFAENRIFTIRNVVDEELIKKKSREGGPYLVQDGLLNVVSVGRLCQAKGFSRAVRVHQRLEKEGIHFRWYIVGEGYLRAKLEKEIAAKGLKNRFILLGQKVNPYPYILQADILAMPSRAEGWCLAVTEAKILGRPILFTDVSGAREQIESEVNGLVVANGEDAIYRGLKRLLKDESLRHKFSEALLGFTYDNRNIYNQIERVLFSHAE